MANIGFVGLGHMGLPMAINLIKAGHQVSGFDLQQHALEQLQAAGGIIAPNLPSVASGQEVVITMLQTGAQVKQVCLGDNGLFDSMYSSSLYIDCSTIDVESSRFVHAQAQNRGLSMLDAPVSGGVAGAVAGSLTFIVGGEQQAFDAAYPLLSVMGQKIIHTGKAGNGQAAKICNNMILGISMVAVSEAFVLAQQLGLAPAKLFDVVTNASGQCWAMSKYAPVPGVLDNVPANNDYQPGFAAAMMLKDLLLSQDTAASAAVDTPLGAKSTALYQQLIDEGLGHLDFSAIIQLIASRES